MSGDESSGQSSAISRIFPPSLPHTCRKESPFRDRTTTKSVACQQLNSTCLKRTSALKHSSSFTTRKGNLSARKLSETGQWSEARDDSRLPCPQRFSAVRTCRIPRDTFENRPVLVRCLKEEGVVASPPENFEHDGLIRCGVFA
jgi:hypothetical protein